MIPKKNSFISILLAATLLTTNVAAETAPNISNTGINLIIKSSVPSVGYDDETTDDEGNFVSLTVPSVIPFIFNEDGTTSTPDNFEIKNWSHNDVKIDNIYLETTDKNWKIHQVEKDAQPGDYFKNKGYNVPEIELLVGTLKYDYYNTHANELIDHDYFNMYLENASIGTIDDENRINDLDFIIWGLGEQEEKDYHSITLDFDVYRTLFTEESEVHTAYIMHIDFSYYSIFDQYGAIYGTTTDGSGLAGGGRLAMASSIIDARAVFNLNIDIDTDTGNEYAVWMENGKDCVIFVAEGKTYTDDEIQKYIDNAVTSEGLDIVNPPAKLYFKSELGYIIDAPDTRLAAGTAAGVRQVLGEAATAGTPGNLSDLIDDLITNNPKYASNIMFTANGYGDFKSYFNTLLSKITIKTDTNVGNETVTIDAYDPGSKTELTIHLATEVEYTKSFIENLIYNYYDILLNDYIGYFDYSISLTNANGKNVDVVYFTKDNKQVIINENIAGSGISKDFIDGTVTKRYLETIEYVG